METRQTWRWGGCGDNLAYGRTFATKFLDSGSIDKARSSSGGKSNSRLGANKDSKLNKKKKAVSPLFRRARKTLRMWKVISVDIASFSNERIDIWVKNRMIEFIFFQNT